MKKGFIVLLPVTLMIVALIVYKYFNYELTVIDMKSNSYEKIIVRRDLLLNELPMAQEEDFLCFTDQDNFIINSKRKVFSFDEIHVLHKNSSDNHFVYFVYDNNKIKIELVHDGESIKEPKVPIKEGNIFNYWESDGRIFDFNLPIKKDIVVTSIWSDEKEFGVFNKDNNSKTYSINNKYRFGKKLVSYVSDESVINLQKQDVERDANQIGEGFTTQYVLTGLKKGKAVITVEYRNGDNDVEISKSYYVLVDDELSVSLNKVTSNYIFNIDNSLTPIIKSNISNEKIILLEEEKISFPKDFEKASITQFIVKPQDVGSSDIILNLYDRNGELVSKNIYHFSVNSEFDVIFDGVEKITKE